MCVVLHPTGSTDGCPFLHLDEFCTLPWPTNNCHFGGLLGDVPAVGYVTPGSILTEADRGLALARTTDLKVLLQPLDRFSRQAVASCGAEKVACTSKNRV